MPVNLGELREVVCDLVETHYDTDTRRRFAAWLDVVDSGKGGLALMVVEMALRRTPVGKSGEHRYLLVGFADGEPLLALQRVQ